MATTIEYLSAVHGDLLDAAKREARAGRLRPRRWVPSTGMVAAVVGVLVAAGLIGLIARTGGFGSDEADQRVAGKPIGTGATGATAGVLPEAVPGLGDDQTIHGERRSGSAPRRARDPNRRALGRDPS